jgi:hypothetical protein
LDVEPGSLFAPWDTVLEFGSVATLLDINTDAIGPALGRNQRDADVGGVRNRPHHSCRPHRFAGVAGEDWAGIVTDRCKRGMSG